MGDETCPSNKTFCIVLIAIVFSWILIGLWTTAIKNILYRGLGLSESSWLDTLIVVIVSTGAFLYYVDCVEEKALIRTKMTGILVSPVDVSLSLSD